MSGPSEKDRELKAYLRGDSALSKAYKKAASELPPQHLDAQILAEAHRADAGTARPRAPAPFSGSWMVPASVTAVVLLAVSVAVLLPEGQPGFERQRDRLEDAAAPAAGAPVADKLEQQERKQAPESTFAPAPPRPLDAGEGAAEAARPRQSEITPAEIAAPAMEQRSVQEKESAPAAPAEMPRRESGDSVELLRKRSAAPSGRATTADEGVAGKSRSDVVTDAGAWLERIEMLIARGEIEAARESLAEFRRVYPRAEVPQSILDALAGSGN